MLYILTFIDGSLLGMIVMALCVAAERESRARKK